MNLAQVVFDSQGVRLHGSLHAAEPPGAPAFVFCHPLFEERKSACRAMAEAADAFCRRGFSVLRFDYRGCGDSGGAFADFAVGDWEQDIVAALEFVRTSCAPRAVGLAGLRLGAALALRVAAHRDDVAWALLWEPVVNGRVHLGQELRKKLTKEMVTFGKTRVTRASLFEQLEQGQSIDFDGYPLSARLYRELVELDLGTAAPHGGLRCLVAAVTPTGTPSPEASELSGQLAATACASEAAGVRLQPFWNLVGYVHTGELATVSLDWLARQKNARPAPASTRGPAPAPPGGPDHERAPETAVTFPCDGRLLRGILGMPEGAAPRAGIVFLHGWSGCRLGPHRMFVSLSRRLVAAGFACLRFDVAGRGESDGQAGAATIETMTHDACAAAEWMKTRHGTDRVVLLGICSGAKVAIATAEALPGIRHLVLWSAEAMGDLRNAATRARRSLGALKAYARKLVSPRTWRKLLSGRVNVGLVGKAIAQTETPDLNERAAESRVLHGFRRFPGEILFLYGSRDPDTSSAAQRYLEFCRRWGVANTMHEIPDANHSFYGLEWEQRVFDLTAAWLDEHVPGR